MKHFFLFLLLGVSLGASAQLPDTIPLNTDSIERELDAFLKLYGPKKEQSYFLVGAGLSNIQSSLSNLALNAQQQSRGVTLLPTLQYMHKSGLNLSYTGYLLTSRETSGFMQHALTPGFEFSRQKHFDFGLYYTRFLGNNRFDEFSSPYRNDWYAYAEYKRWYLQPSLALGYSTGRFTETSKTDSSIRIPLPFPRPDTLIRFSIYDTLSIGLRDFSVIFTLRHQYQWASHNRKTYYTFTPALLLFFLQNRYEVEYTSVSVLDPRTRIFLQNRPLLRDQLVRQLQQQFPGLNQTRNFLGSTDFNLQSLGLSLDAAVYWGKWYLNPNLYIDYYLLSSTGKWTGFFQLQTGFFF
ncbi:MAG TPA: hypothetical protein PKE63_06790 [Lacibacter sp.]|nr:hypothetical protein [Lacibacter sp.]HMO87637.1 hypothetical protein [Lacibacter sp.]HMP86966.1 hypothetical protein [Lacibacter sp.]